MLLCAGRGALQRREGWGGEARRAVNSVLLEPQSSVQRRLCGCPMLEGARESRLSGSASAAQCSTDRASIDLVRMLGTAGTIDLASCVVDQ